MQTMWIAIPAGLTLALSVYLFATRKSLLVERFDRYGSSMEETAAKRSTWDSWKGFLVRSIAPRVEALLPSHHIEKIRANLRRAGMHGAGHFNGYLAIQGLLPVVGVAAGLAFGGKLALILALLLGGVLCMVPTLMLSQIVKKRQAAINGSLSDSLDLLTACVEAGLGLDAALAQLIRRRSSSCQIINEEFSRYLQELQMGVPRQEALRNLGTRSDVEDLRHVVTALMQGDALGVGVSQILRAQAQHLRLRRKQRAEEKAMKAPIKILFPLAFCIFPSIFVIILGPAALQIYDTLIAKPL